MQTTKEKFDSGPLSPNNDTKAKRSRRPQTYTKHSKSGRNREIVISDAILLKNSRNKTRNDSGPNIVDSEVESPADQSPTTISKFTQSTQHANSTVMNESMSKNQEVYNRRKEIQNKYNSLQANMVHKKMIKPKTVKQEQSRKTPSQQSPPKHRNSQNSEMLENAIQVLFTMKPRSESYSKRSGKVSEIRDEDLSDDCSEFKAEHGFKKNLSTKQMKAKTSSNIKVDTRWTFDEPISSTEQPTDCYKKLIEIKEVVEKQSKIPRSKVDTRWSFDVPSMASSTANCYKQLLDIEAAARKLERLQTDVKLHIASQPVQVTTSTSITNFPRNVEEISIQTDAIEEPTEKIIQIDESTDYSNIMAILPVSNMSVANLVDSYNSIANSSCHTIQTQLSCTSMWTNLQENPLDLSVNQNNSATALMRLSSRASSFLQRPDFISFNYSVDTGKRLVNDPQSSLSTNVVKRSETASCRILSDAQLNGAEVYTAERLNALLGKLSILLGPKQSSSSDVVRTESITCMFKNAKSTQSCISQSEWNQDCTPEVLEFPSDFNLIYEQSGQLNRKYSNQSVYAALDVSLDKHLTDSEPSFLEVETKTSNRTVIVKDSSNEQLSVLEQAVEILPEVELSDEIFEDSIDLKPSGSLIKIQLNKDYFRKYNDDQQRFYELYKKQRLRREQLKKNGLSVIYVCLFLSLFAGFIVPQMQCLNN